MSTEHSNQSSERVTLGTKVIERDGGAELWFQAEGNKDGTGFSVTQHIVHPNANPKDDRRQPSVHAVAPKKDGGLTMAEAIDALRDWELQSHTGHAAENSTLTGETMPGVVHHTDVEYSPKNETFEVSKTPRVAQTANKRNPTAAKLH